MCVPQAIQAAQLVINTALGVTKTVTDYNMQVKNNEYRSQVAMMNIKSAQKEAQNQIQLGIDKSREEKIEGLKKASALLTQNASSGFDAVNDTNKLNYLDVQNVSFANAQNIQDRYNQKADSYFQKANNYLANYKNYQRNYKASLFKSAINSLGNYSKVASSWYSNYTENGDYDSI